jgi:hypothetical protein
MELSFLVKRQRIAKQFRALLTLDAASLGSGNAPRRPLHRHPTRRWCWTFWTMWCVAALEKAIEGTPGTASNRICTATKERSTPSRQPAAFRRYQPRAPARAGKPGLGVQPRVTRRRSTAKEAAANAATGLRFSQALPLGMGNLLVLEDWKQQRRAAIRANIYRI